MNFVSQDGKIDINANFVCSNPFEIRVCQKQEYYAIYWKLRRNYVKFYKNQKIQQRILLQKGDQILSVALSDYLQAFLCQQSLKVYFKRKKLITKCQNRNYSEQITFTIDNQIILKGNAEFKRKNFEWGTDNTCKGGVITAFQIYNFVTKSFTICYIGGSNEVRYEYCSINNIILIPTGNLKENQISVWGVAERKVINQISIYDYLYDFEMKMSQSGQYLLDRDYQSNVLYIYCYGEKVTFYKKISYIKIQLDRSWNIEWIQDQQCFLLHRLNKYKILQYNYEIVDCQLQKQNGISGKYQQASKKKIYIISQKRGQFIDYFQIKL